MGKRRGGVFWGLRGDICQDTDTEDLSGLDYRYVLRNILKEYQLT